MRKGTRSLAIWTASLISAAVGVSCLAPMAQAGEPSLDDLLNLPVKPGAGKPRTDDKATDTNTPAPPGQPAIPLNPEVKKRLTEKEVADLYRGALADMRVAAERLSNDRDPGADTQNAQQEAIDKLARLITDLERQQQSNSKSKPKSGDPKDGQQQQQGDKGSEQNSGKPGSGKPGNSSGGGKGQGQDKPGQDGKKGDEPGKKTDNGKTDGGKDFNPDGRIHDGSNVPPGGGIAGGTPTTPLEEAKANWGNLPPRVRDELIEGIGEKFSPVYREMTESYYKRLAEEKK